MNIYEKIAIDALEKTAEDVVVPAAIGGLAGAGVGGAAYNIHRHMNQATISKDNLMRVGRAVWNSNNPDVIDASVMYKHRDTYNDLLRAGRKKITGKYKYIIPTAAIAGAGLGVMLGRRKKES